MMWGGGAFQEGVVHPDVFQMGQSRWWEQEIPMEGSIQKGELLTYNLTELVKPESYLVRLTPITRYGEGDATERIIIYSGMMSCVAAHHLLMNVPVQCQQPTTRGPSRCFGFTPVSHLPVQMFHIKTAGLFHLAGF